MAKPLRPTLKERKRFMVYRPRDDQDVLAAYRELFGITGLAQAGIRSMDAKDDMGILRIAHDNVDELKAALVWSGKCTVTVSGTLKKARAALG